MKKIIRLTESDLARIVKRVINERQNLNESRPPWKKNMGDPSWLGTQSTAAFGGNLTSGYPDGASYVQQFSYAGANAGLNGDNHIILLPKGTQWTLSPSKYFLLAKGFKAGQNFGYGENGKLTGLQDGMYIAKVAQGKGVGIDGKPVSVYPVNVAVTPGIGGVFWDGGDMASNLIWPNNNLFKTLQGLGTL
jgi:hypothetical protein